MSTFKGLSLAANPIAAKSPSLPKRINSAPLTEGVDVKRKDSIRVSDDSPMLLDKKKPLISKRKNSGMPSDLEEDAGFIRTEPLKGGSDSLVQNQPTVLPSIQKQLKKPSLGVIKENKFNEAQYNNSSVLKPRSQMDYSDLVCSQCQDYLLRVYHHCMADQDKAIPSPHHIDEIADAKRKRPPPFFELLKDPTIPKNNHYKNNGEKSAREIKARNMSKKVDDFQRGAILSHFEKLYIHSHDPHTPCSNNHVVNHHQQNIISSHSHQHVHIHQHKDGSFSSLGEEKARPSSAGASFASVPNETFPGSLYKHTLQIKNHEIEKLREQLIEKSESERRELENVRRLKKALSKSMRFYIKAEEWQQEEASDLQEDIRTLKKEMSVIMACLIHSESEKKELRSTIMDRENTISNRDAHIQQLDDQVAELRAKLHDSLKDYIRLNEKIAAMAKQAEMGSDQAEERNNILQKNLDGLTKTFAESSNDLSKAHKKISELESELDFFVRQVNDLSRLKKELIKENDTLQQELFTAQQDIQKYMETDAQDKIRIGSLEMELRANMIKAEADSTELHKVIAELNRKIDDNVAARKEEEANNAKLVSENTRLKANLKEVTQKRDILDSAVKDLNELRKTEITERDKIIQELMEQAKVAKSEALMFEERRERAMLQLNELQGALDHEMTQNRMMIIELDRQKRDYNELKTSTKLEMEKLSDMKNILTTDKMSLTKNVYELRQELKEKKDEHQKLLLDYRTQETETGNRIKGLENTVQTLTADLNDLNQKYTEITTQYQSLTNVHDAQTNEYQGLLKRFDDTETSLRRTRMEYSNLISYKDTILKEKSDISARKDELEILYASAYQKTIELTTQKNNMERENSIQTAARDASIDNLTRKVKSLQDELKKMTDSNNEFRELCNKLNEDVANLKKNIQDLLTLNAAFEESIDALRQDLSTERRTRLEFERMNQRLDQKLAEKQSNRLIALQNRDKTLNVIDETMHSEVERLSDIVEIIQRPPPPPDSAGSSAPMTSVSGSGSRPETKGSSVQSPNKKRGAVSQARSPSHR